MASQLKQIMQLCITGGALAIIWRKTKGTWFRTLFLSSAVNGCIGIAFNV